jgi:hypothetical protein
MVVKGGYKVVIHGIRIALNVHLNLDGALGGHNEPL